MEIESKLLLKPENIKPSFKDWEIVGVFNPGAVRMPNKKILLMARVAEKVKASRGKDQVYPIIISDKDYGVKYGKVSKGKILDKGRRVTYLKGGVCRLNTISHLRRVILSPDGFFVEKIEEIPAFVGSPGNGELGVEDPRIIKMGKKYFMTYVSACLKEGICTSLATSKNLKHWDKKGIIFRQQNKDVVLFPEKINGLYVALHRPEGTIEFSKKSIWISHSPDMIYWGREKSIMMSRAGSWGDAWIGSGTPPIKTKKGWLIFYHGVKDTRTKKFYAIGAALLDLKDPSKVIARTPPSSPLVKPEYKYEKKGFVNGVVFPTGAVKTLDEKSVLLYCGGADSNLVVKKINIQKIIDSLEVLNE